LTDRNDSDASFEALVRPELQRLYRLAYRLSGAANDAEDLVQNVLIKAYERRRELSSIDGLGAWLARVMYNAFVDDLRRHKRRRFTVVPLDDALDQPHDAAALASSGLQPSQLQERHTLRVALAKALAELSIEHRTVVLMHDSEGYTLEEIQQITGIPIGTLKSRLHRARARLRSLLDDGTISAARTLSE